MAERKYEVTVRCTGCGSALRVEVEGLTFSRAALDAGEVFRQSRSRLGETAIPNPDVDPDPWNKHTSVCWGGDDV